MKLIHKISITITTLLVAMLILPMTAVKFAPTDWGFAMLIIMFLIVNPFAVIGLSIMAGTEMRKLWWIPFASAVVFPIFFGAAVQEIVMDLFVYSILYFAVGMIAMLGTHFGVKLVRKRR